MPNRSQRAPLEPVLVVNIWHPPAGLLGMLKNGSYLRRDTPCRDRDGFSSTGTATRTQQILPNARPYRPPRVWPSTPTTGAPSTVVPCQPIDHSATDPPRIRSREVICRNVLDIALNVTAPDPTIASNRYATGRDGANEAARIAIPTAAPTSPPTAG